MKKKNSAGGVGRKAARVTARSQSTQRRSTLKSGAKARTGGGR